MNSCDSLPKEWDRIHVVLSDIADSLRLIARRERAESPQSKAIRLLFELGPDNVSAIAKAVGVNRGTLYRWPGFQEALQRQRAAAAWTVRNPNAVRSDEL